MSHVSQTTSTSSLRAFGALALVATLLGTSGCAGSVQRWIVNTRVHQGDVALERGNVGDAELSYNLAMRIDPKDARARAGFVLAAAALAQEQYTKGSFDDALKTIRDGLKIDPTSVRLAALETTLEDAKLKREIVISNYPTYHAAGVTLQHSYEQLDETNKTILKALKRFSYSYDTEDLTKAIKQSYELEIDVARNTNRLIAYRQLVSSGVPETTRGTVAPGGGASLLPLP
ncbi:MAG: hypothetical protein KGN02_01050 [bacterium]|nr:hypothetical protein [bacterium]